MRQEEECYWCRQRTTRWHTVGAGEAQSYLCLDCYGVHQEARLARYRAVQAMQEQRQEEARIDRAAYAAFVAFRGILPHVHLMSVEWHTVTGQDLWRGVARAVLDAAQKGQE